MNKQVSVILLAACLLLSPRAFAQAAHEPAPGPSDAVKTPVVLDVIARDKKGHPVLDLTADEVRVFDDGKQQQIRDFHFAGGEAGAAPRAATATVPGAAPQHARLVTLLFDTASAEGRNFARDAAGDFLASDIGDSTLVSVFVINQRLYALQEFTNDRATLRTAIQRATSGGNAVFPEANDRVRRRAEDAVASLSSAGRADDGQLPAARAMVGILNDARQMEVANGARTAVFALLALAQNEGAVAGRKTIVYFSEGLSIDANTIEQFRGLMSTANRGNVSFYTVDTRGLVIDRQSQSASDALSSAADASRSLGATAGEAVESTIRQNGQESLATMARSTSGFAIANTNDVRSGMRRLAEDLRGYYELAYVLPSPVYDGAFHSIKVETTRPGIVLQSRSGYFAVPLVAGGPALLPYEAAMAGALAGDPLPHQFEYHAQTLRFDASNEGVEHTVVVQAPISTFASEEDAKAKVFRRRFAVLAMVKEQGKIVRKLSQSYSLNIPADRMEASSRGSLVFARNFRVPPGRYTVETVVQDQLAGKARARRSVLIVPASIKGVHMSSLLLIRKADRVKPGEDTSDDPFLFQSLRITPNLESTIFGGSSGVPLFFVIYPSAEIAEKPELALECTHEGAVIATAKLPLGQPDENGRIAFAGVVPLEKLEPGEYQLRAVVRQGSSAAQEFAFFTVTR